MVHFSVSRRTHTLLSSLIWSMVGMMLLMKGFYRSPDGLAMLLLPLCGLIAGVLKSRLVLDGVAGRTQSRINTLEEPAPVWQVYSRRSWLLVAAMIVTGIVLKYSPLPAILLCFIYFTVGWALLLSSRHGWLLYFHGEETQ